MEEQDGKRQSGWSQPAAGPLAVGYHSPQRRRNCGRMGRGQEALPQIVRQVREGSRQPYGTFLRRVLFFWLRVYVFEFYTNGKSKAVNVRIPIPLPLSGAFFQSKLSWSQAFQFIERSRRTQGIPAERFLESCMALEFVRVYEDKEEKEEMVVVGLD